MADLVFLNSIDDLAALLECRSKGELRTAGVLTYHPHVRFLIHSKYPELMTGATGTEDTWNVPLAKHLGETGHHTHRLMENWFRNAPAGSDISKYGPLLAYQLIRLLQAYQNYWEELFENLRTAAPSRVFSFTPSPQVDLYRVHLNHWPAEPQIYSTFLAEVATALGIEHRQVARPQPPGLISGVKIDFDTHEKPLIKSLFFTGKLLRNWLILKHKTRLFRRKQMTVSCVNPSFPLLLYLWNSGKKPVFLNENTFFSQDGGDLPSTLKTTDGLVGPFIRELAEQRTFSAMTKNLASMLNRNVCHFLNLGIERLKLAENRIRTWLPDAKLSEDIYFGSLFTPECLLLAKSLKERGHKIIVQQHGGSYGAFISLMLYVEQRYCDEFLCFGERTKQGLIEANAQMERILAIQAPSAIRFTAISHLMYGNQAISNARALATAASEKLLGAKQGTRKVLLVTCALMSHLNYVASYRQRDVFEAATHQRIIEIMKNSGERVTLYFKPFQGFIQSPYADKRLGTERVEIVPILSGWFWDYVDLADIIILPTPATTLLEAATSVKKKTVIAYTGADRGAICTGTCKDLWPENIVVCHDSRTFFESIRLAVGKNSPLEAKDMRRFREQFISANAQG